MSLTDRISITGPFSSSPEDILSTTSFALSPYHLLDAHGDADHGIIYTSPYLPKPLHLELADPIGEADRLLFSHYLWNASLMLAELIEAGSLGLGAQDKGKSVLSPETTHFDVRGRRVLELGAGTALPSILASLLGAARVVITDYPAPVVLSTLKANVARNVTSAHSVLGKVADQIIIEGHAWGNLDRGGFADGNHHAFDRILVADCLWMPWQHANLMASLSYFLASSTDARVWVVAGFHTGRDNIRGFFDAVQLGCAGLEVERIWERDVLGAEREWDPNRKFDTTHGERRWLVIAVLKRKVGNCQGIES